MDRVLSFSSGRVILIYAPTAYGFRCRVSGPLPRSVDSGYRNLTAAVPVEVHSTKYQDAAVPAPVYSSDPGSDRPFAESGNCPRGGPCVGAPRSRGQSLVMSEKAVTAHRDITALFSLSCPIVSVTATLPECFCLFFFPPSVLFFPLLFVGFYTLSFFSLCLCPSLLSSLFGSLSLLHAIHHPS